MKLRLKFDPCMTRVFDEALERAVGKIEQTAKKGNMPVDTGALRARIVTNLTYGRFVENGQSSVYTGCSGTRTLRPGINPATGLRFGTWPTGTHIDLAGMSNDDHIEYKHQLLGKQVSIVAWQCPWCDLLNDQGMQTCGGCGTNREAGVPTRMACTSWKCPWCRGLNHMVFICSKCGSKRSFEQ